MWQLGPTCNFDALQHEYNVNAQKFLKKKCNYINRCVCTHYSLRARVRAGILGLGLESSVTAKNRL